MDKLSVLLQGLFLAVAFGASYAQDTSGSNITFPSEPGFPISVLDPPGCTAGLPDPSAPCEEDGDYNDSVRELVSRLLARSSLAKENISDPQLNVILNDSLPPSPPLYGFTPSIRFNLKTESPACVYREEWIFPQRAKTPKNTWVYVVNQEGARQALKVERCIKRDEPCDIGIPHAGDVSTICRQKYIYRRMWVMESNHLKPAEVLMPSCCACYIRSWWWHQAIQILGENKSTLPLTQAQATTPAPLRHSQLTSNLLEVPSP